MKQIGILLLLFLLVGMYTFADGNTKVLKNTGFYWHLSNSAAAKLAPDFMDLNSLFFDTRHEFFSVSLLDTNTQKSGTQRTQKNYADTQNNNDVLGFVLSMTGYSAVWAYTEKNPALGQRLSDRWEQQAEAEKFNQRFIKR